jgi:hypothetical protein
MIDTLRKTLLIATATAALATPALANDWNLTCYPPVSANERNPVVETHFQLSDDGIGVIHILADGTMRDRGNQYYNTKLFWNDNRVVWTGRLESNPHVTIRGVFNIVRRGIATYTESWSHDGRFTNKSASARCITTPEEENS